MHVSFPNRGCGRCRDRHRMAFNPTMFNAMGRRTTTLSAFAAVLFILVVTWYHLSASLPPRNLATVDADRVLPQGVQPASKKVNSRCTPRSWASGKWVYRSVSGEGTSTGYPIARSEQDALALLGFSGCASKGSTKRHTWWHLGASDATKWDRYPGVASWKWMPGEDCGGFEERTSEWMVKELVEGGGWFLIGGMFYST